MALVLALWALTLRDGGWVSLGLGALLVVVLALAVSQSPTDGAGASEGGE